MNSGLGKFYEKLAQLIKETVTEENIERLLIAKDKRPYRDFPKEAVRKLVRQKIREIFGEDDENIEYYMVRLYRAIWVALASIYILVFYRDWRRGKLAKEKLDWLDEYTYKKQDLGWQDFYPARAALYKALAQRFNEEIMSAPYEIREEIQNYLENLFTKVLEKFAKKATNIARRLNRYADYEKYVNIDYWYELVYLKKIIKDMMDPLKPELMMWLIKTFEIDVDFD